jgi:ferric-dicitrate binding protein FerR (iron transport regulator)
VDVEAREETTAAEEEATEAVVDVARAEVEAAEHEALEQCRDERDGHARAQLWRNKMFVLYRSKHPPGEPVDLKQKSSP